MLRDSLLRVLRVARNCILFPLLYISTFIFFEFYSVLLYPLSSADSPVALSPAVPCLCIRSLYFACTFPFPIPLRIRFRLFRRLRPRETTEIGSATRLPQIPYWHQAGNKHPTNSLLAVNPRGFSQ